MQIQLGALHSPLYRRYWLGSLASIGATQLLMLGKGWLVFELSGSPLKLGLLGAAGAIPQILVTLFGGVLADTPGSCEFAYWIVHQSIVGRLSSIR